MGTFVCYDPLGSLVKRTIDNRERKLVMPRRAGHRLCRVVLAAVVASVLALVITSGPVEARNLGTLPGCAGINSLPTDLTTGFGIGVTFFGGEVVSVTASAPTTGSPNTVEIELVGTGIVASSAFPGTATLTVPGPFSGVLTLTVDTGEATLDPNCIPAPPTATPTDIPTATNTPTATATNTPTNTPTETQTPDPSVTATTVPTEIAVPATEEPNETPTSTATSDTTGGVTELPDTGSRPGGGSGQSRLWLILTLLAATGLSITSVRVRQRH
jgi:hypothetical protein